MVVNNLVQYDFSDLIRCSIQLLFSELYRQLLTWKFRIVGIVSNKCRNSVRIAINIRSR